jgi:hypothetical protein
MPVPEKMASIMEEECAHILRSAEFRRSPVMSHLLEFLVQFCIQRDARGPKAYTVAVDGLGRDDDFDPNMDSYPRVQVGRLRRMIAGYYASHPRPTRLHIPLGHYQVQLVDHDVREPMLATTTEVEANAVHEIRTNESGRSQNIVLISSLAMLAASIVILGMAVYAMG